MSTRISTAYPVLHRHRAYLPAAHKATGGRWGIHRMQDTREQQQARDMGMVKFPRRFPADLAGPRTHLQLALPLPSPAVLSGLRTPLLRAPLFPSLAVLAGPHMHLQQVLPPQIIPPIHPLTTPLLSRESSSIHTIHIITTAIKCPLQATVPHLQATGLPQVSLADPTFLAPLLGSPAVLLSSLVLPPSSPVVPRALNSPMLAPNSPRAQGFLSITRRRNFLKVGVDIQGPRIGEAVIR